MFPQIGGRDSNSFDTFLEKNFIDHQKNGKNWEYTQKSENMSKNSKFSNFWAKFNMKYMKRKHFHIEFNFKQKSMDCLKKKRKDIFFILFVKIYADLVSSIINFSNLCNEI